jgi:hypothetical protein
MSEECKLKRCSKCGRELPSTTEYFHKGQSKDGFKTQCKECRGYTFGKTRKCNSKRTSWTDEQINYLKSNYSNSDMKTLITLINKSEHSINTMSVSLGLYKEKLWWTEEELDIMRSKYTISPSAKYIMENYLCNRTETSIRKKAFELGLKNQNIDSIRIDNFKDYTNLGKENPNYKGIKETVFYARNRIGKWVKNIKSKCNNECQITLIKNDLTVHHLRAFSFIFDKVAKEYIDKYDFQIYPSIDTYYKNNTIDMFNNFTSDVLKEHKIEDGILICTKLHNLFHSEGMYGSKNNTKEQFEEFTKRYYKGEFDNELEESLKSYNSIKRLSEKKINVKLKEAI